MDKEFQRGITMSTEDETQPLKKNMTDREISMFLLKSYMTLNKEMGEVRGELKWIKWLLCALLAVAIGQYFIV
jgi:hypothetical protein